MLRSMTWRQFKEWIVFADLEPFDDIRDDYRFASIVTAIANANRNPKRRAKPYTLEDGLLKFGDHVVKKPKQTWQQQKAIAMFYASAFNHKEKSKKPKNSKGT